MVPAMAPEDSVELGLRRIVQNPDEDGLRLRLAEMLDEHPAYPGWGRFIRIHLQLANLAQALDQPGGFGLLQQAKSLFREHGRNWVPHTWRALELPLPRYEHFHRGLVELLEAPGRRIVEAGAELFQLAPVRHINLRDLSGCSLADVAAALAPYRIRSLSLVALELTGGQLRDVDWASLSSLRWISLAGNDSLRREDVAGLVRQWRGALPNLEHVNFDGVEADPREALLYDQDAVAGASQPEWASGLERDGIIAWLHPKVFNGYARTVDRLLLGLR